MPDTHLVIPDDVLALPIGGKNNNITRQQWLNFADYCKIPERAAKRLLSEQVDALDPTMTLIALSFLTDEMKEQYEQIVRGNTAILTS